MKKITAFTQHTTAEGERVSFTYSEINSAGEIIKSNARATIIALDPEVLSAIKTIKDFLETKIPD